MEQDYTPPVPVEPKLHEVHGYHTGVHSVPTNLPGNVQHHDHSHMLVSPTPEEVSQAILQSASEEGPSAEEVLNSMSAEDFQAQGLLDPQTEEDLKKKGKKRKKGEGDENSKKRICLAVGCEREITRRYLCPAHSKQKQRNGGKIELKNGEKLAAKPGRPNKPFSEQARPYHKLQSFDKKIDEWAGGKSEGNIMLLEYLASSFFETRLPEHTNAETFEAIGRNIVRFLEQLPEKSPFRKPLIKAIGKEIPVAKLEKVITFGKTTISKSFRLADEKNLLLSIRYKPNVKRKRPGKEDDSLEPGKEGGLPPGLTLELNNLEPVGYEGQL